MAALNWRKIKISVVTPSEVGKSYCDNTIITSRYTILTFLPKVLFEQFRHISNFFFLALIILQLSLEVPTDPSAYIVAFAVVITVSTIKQGYEDWLRHKADEKVNQQKIWVIDPDGNLKQTRSRDLRVGQIIQLCENEAVPADILLLSCVDANGHGISKCEINTANLDGEPNKKIRTCPSGMSRCNSSVDLSKFLTSDSFLIEYDQPSADLYKFNGILSTSTSKPFGLTMENILLRGTTLNNSEFIFGCVIYTGTDTRLGHNSSKIKKNKFCVVDVTINRLVYLMFGLLFVLCSTITGLYFWYRDSTVLSQAWYIPIDEDSNLWQGIITFLLFLIFLSYLIPISLSVTIELQKFGCSKFFGWDNDMKCEKRNIRAICNTSDLNEELGQINYLLTDKTGTLTENNLKFGAFSIGGQIYSKNDLENPTPEILEFLEALALCHTVQRIEDADSFKYYGPSPDEEILVTTAHELGVSFMGEGENDFIKIESPTGRKEFKRHLVLDFDSDRKAMSVIVEDSVGRVFVITKGAESSLLPKCQQNSEAAITFQHSMDHVTKFAEKGFRTLVIAKKELDQTELSQISAEMDVLRRSPDKLQAFYSEIESNFKILGVTAVEDELQENVNETLRLLKEAGIKIWMLTGDKLETAVNIGRSCALIAPNSNIYTLAEIKNPKELELKLTEIDGNNIGNGDTTLVIDGTTFAVGFIEFLNLFAKICMTSSQVILCRLTPLQKAQVVKLIQAADGGQLSRVCAVGDGGNDVAMLQEAHIGIGIIGREGTQASRSADFAVPNFQSLQKAILIQGYWYYYRTATLVSYFFYRGILFVLPQLFYGINSAFSGQTIYHASYMMCYSLMFSSTPILIYGLTEQPKSPEQLIENPSLYKSISGNALLTWRSGGLWWTMILLWHALIIWFIPPLIWPTQFQFMDWGMQSHFINGLMVAVTDMKVVTDTIHFTWLTLFCQVSSYVQVLIFYSLSSEILTSAGGGELKFVYFPLLSQPDFWAVTILICILAIIPDLIKGGMRRLRIIQARNRRKILSGKS